MKPFNRATSRKNEENPFKQTNSHVSGTEMFIPWWLLPAVLHICNNVVTCICKTFWQQDNKPVNKEANSGCTHEPCQFYQRDEDVCAGGRRGRWGDGTMLQRTTASLNTLCGSWCSSSLVLQSNSWNGLLWEKLLLELKSRLTAAAAAAPRTAADC